MTRHTLYPSRIIDIGKLDRESRRWFCIGLVFGICFLTCITAIKPYRTHRRVTLQKLSGIPVELLTLLPDTTNPYTAWEYEQTEKTTLRPEAAPVVPDAEPAVKRSSIMDEQYSIDSHEVTKQVLDTQEDREDTLIAALAPAYPDTLFTPYRDLSIPRNENDRFSMNDLMISLDEIDALGQFKGFVIRDLTDKQNIRGYFHIPVSLLEMEPGISDALIGLSEAFNLFTGLTLITDRSVTLTDSILFSYPVIYISSVSYHAREVDTQQVNNFRNYLTHGGFAIIDNGLPWIEWLPAKASLLNLLVKTFGDSINIKPLPRDHLLFNCFFDIDMPLPEGAEKWTPSPIRPDDIPDWGNLFHDKSLNMLKDRINKSKAVLWGIWYDDRLVALYSDKGYGYIWQRGIINNQSWDFYAGSDEKYNFNPQLKLGVNMLVYALLQEGGIAKKMTDYAEK